MKFPTLIILSTVLSLPLSFASADIHPGKAIHDEGCLKCHKGNHDAAFYTRKDRKTKTLDRLQTMVRMCDARMGTALFDEDMAELVDYLNTEFYKFPKQTK